ncbi:MAG TPA: disulfide bond formation protein B [Spongiibacteraceae bacterium]|nr:disulfide bond formation protein B [Spongiibacteraceae bacterium]
MSFVLAPRPLFFLIAATIVGLFSIALYTQYVGGLDPCPLCMTQRFFYATTALIAVLAGLHNRQRRLYGSLLAISALAGAAVAARQVWLQHLPPNEVPACGPSLEYMLQTLPFGDVLVKLFKGDGNCAVVDWRLFGLSMAEWSLVWFFILAAAGAWQIFRKSAER